MESFVPIEFGSDNISYTQNDLLPIESGLKPNQFMSFALLGPPYPNLSSIRYGINLTKGVCSSIKDTPIIGSIIANFGSEEEVVHAAQNIVEAGVKGIELNFSCPNVLALYEDGKKIDIVYRKNPSLSIVKSVKEITGVGISIKLTPGQMLSSFDQNILKYIDGITYSNAYLGLVPPTLGHPFDSPFQRERHWSYSGVYGPFERLLTYEMLAKVKTEPLYKNINLSVIGGLVEEKNIVEAILLGANNIQLSSAVMWKGLGFAKNMVTFLEKFMQDNKFNSLDEFRGKSLAHIHSCASSIEAYSHTGNDKPKNQRQEMIITNKCVRCYKCIDGCCIALTKQPDNSVSIVHDLCSGCGWCQVICPVNRAIIRSG